MTDTNQKLREALCELMHIVSIHQRATRNNFAWAEMAFAREALALPTADHIPDAGGMVADHLPEAGKMIETAAPVCERDALDAARYRWLADCNNYPEAVTLISDGSLTADALGKAIDAAMRKGQL